MDWLKSLTQDKALRDPILYRHLFFGLIAGFSISYSTATLLGLVWKRKRTVSLPTNESLRTIEIRNDEIVHGVSGLIGS